jgi:hypothetical protein
MQSYSPTQFSHLYEQQPTEARGALQLREGYDAIDQYLTEKELHGVVWPWNAPAQFNYITTPGEGVRSGPAGILRGTDHTRNYGASALTLTRCLFSHARAWTDIMLPEITTLAEKYDIICLGRAYTWWPPKSPVQFSRELVGMPGSGDTNYLRLSIQKINGTWQYIRTIPSSQCEVCVVMDFRKPNGNLAEESEGKRVFFE